MQVLVPVLLAAFFYAGDADGLGYYPAVIDKADEIMGETVPRAVNNAVFCNRFAGTECSQPK